MAGAFAILAIGVYLFLEVKATPAQANPTGTVSARPSQITEHTQATAPTPPSPTPRAPTAQPPAPTQPQLGSAPIEPSSPPDDTKVNLKLENMMELANKAYDRQDFDEASAIAGKILQKDPNNVRMLRVMVSSNCIGGDSAIAQQYYDRLPKFDRDQMQQRCDRYGVVFKEPQ
jgi:hypothetical protein